MEKHRRKTNMELGLGQDFIEGLKLIEELVCVRCRHKRADPDPGAGSGPIITLWAEGGFLTAICFNV